MTMLRVGLNLIPIGARAGGWGVTHESSRRPWRRATTSNYICS